MEQQTPTGGCRTLTLDEAIAHIHTQHAQHAEIRKTMAQGTICLCTVGLVAGLIYMKKRELDHRHLN
jgi:hypothetical protein